MEKESLKTFREPSAKNQYYAAAVGNLTLFHNIF